MVNRPETSLYRQVADQVMLSLGSAPTPGTRLESERSLCSRYGVSRVTMRAALQLLEREGLVVAAPARGWFTSALPVSASTPSGTLAGFSQLAASQGQRTTAVVLGQELRPSTIDEAELFAIVPGAPVFELSRLRYLEGLVIALDNSRVPAALCTGIETHDFSTESLYATLSAAAQPVVPTSAEYAVEAVPATVDEASLLELPPGTPLLVANQRTRDQLGRTVELGRTSYRGDRFRFRATISASG